MYIWGEKYAHFAIKLKTPYNVCIMVKGLIVVLAVVILAGCVPGQKKEAGGFMRSDDGGRSFEQKVAIDEEKSIGRVSVLSMSVNPLDGDHVYIGTASSGIYETRDGAQTWKQTNFPGVSVRGIGISTADTNTLYAAGVVNQRGKVFRSDDAGESWREVYIEPGTETLITTLRVDPIEPDNIYIGTSEGVIIKSSDGGATWRNIYRAEDEIINLEADISNHDLLYVLSGDDSFLRSRDGGATFEDLVNDPDEPDENLDDADMQSLAIDRKNGGVLYIGTEEGILRSSDEGDTWQKVDVIESTSGIPIYAISVHPQNSNQLTFGAGQVIYTSLDSDVNQWATVDSAPGQSVSVIMYNQFNPQVIYVGLRTTE